MNAKACLSTCSISACVCVFLAVAFPICWAALRVIYLSYPDSVRAPSVKRVNTLTHTFQETTTDTRQESTVESTATTHSPAHTGLQFLFVFISLEWQKHGNLREEQDNSHVLSCSFPSANGPDCRFLSNRPKWVCRISGNMKISELLAVGIAWASDTWSGMTEFCYLDVQKYHKCLTVLFGTKNIFKNPFIIFFTAFCCSNIKILKYIDVCVNLTKRKIIEGINTSVRLWMEHFKPAVESRLISYKFIIPQLYQTKCKIMEQLRFKLHYIM